MQYLAHIYVSYKPSVLDPQGEVIKAALHRLAYQNVREVVQGKYFEVRLEAADEEQAVDDVKSLTAALLINQNTETYHFDLQAVPEEG
ncbi:phosphoribosylformylglycinamidine synthase subunit PurS [Weissella halotolerans]|uniref:Phosphoribosylformylglycinamidine synthase subunit PurS n=1 Tax=Weissella halotolerans DSM 20190 TaxID=1123500 RepID=A0A0R2FZ64_9LACO|nr:phosphoribosylformylglycinamidine synthase subunit PurS [Weissella halotolerans]KRN33230.1 hypothetical protein IV68_GL000028 [Weissella halotolerans DSM 20190]